MVEADVGGRSVGLALPFYNANHRVDVRVTDFRPHDLRKFSYRAKVSNFAVLSDDGSSQIGSDRDSDAGNSLDIEADDDDMYTDGNWEWRFALELEDATTGIDEAERARFWVVVDNQAAQCLTNQDAVDLSEDPDSLETLRQRMFLLWGELEEKKAQEQQNGRADGPPPDSDDEAPATKGGDKQQPKQQKHETNLPFSCCVRQFGIKVPEADQNRADAGDGQRWMRVFGLYGTRII